jgi:hypothetical protein
VTPEQKSAVVGFRGNRIQVIAGRPWRSTTDKRRLASGNCRPSAGAGHGVFGRRRQAHEQQIIKVPLGLESACIAAMAAEQANFRRRGF